MNILRVIAAFIVIWLLVRMVRSYRDRARLAASRRSNDRGAMVPCAHCGLHVPKEEAFRKGERYYCSKEHSAKS